MGPQCKSGAIVSNPWTQNTKSCRTPCGIRNEYMCAGQFALPNKVYHHSMLIICFLSLCSFCRMVCSIPLLLVMGNQINMEQFILNPISLFLNTSIAWSPTCGISLAKGGFGLVFHIGRKGLVKSLELCPMNNSTDESHWCVGMCLSLGLTKDLLTV